MGVCGGLFTFIVISGLSEKFVYEVRVIIGAHGEPMKGWFFVFLNVGFPRSSLFVPRSGNYAAEVLALSCSKGSFTVGLLASILE